MSRPRKYADGRIDLMVAGVAVIDHARRRIDISRAVYARVRDDGALDLIAQGRHVATLDAPHLRELLDLVERPR